MIQSFLIHDTRHGVSHLLYDTVLDGKHVFTACGIGNVVGDDALLTPNGRETLFALADYVEYTHGQVCTIRFQEIAGRSVAVKRIRKALEAADNKEIVFFVCRDTDIYDAAVKILNVQWVSPGKEQ